MTTGIPRTAKLPRPLHLAGVASVCAGLLMSASGDDVAPQVVPNVSESARTPYEKALEETLGRPKNDAVESQFDGLTANMRHAGESLREADASLAIEKQQAALEALDQILSSTSRQLSDNSRPSSGEGQQAAAAGEETGESGRTAGPLGGGPARESTTGERSGGPVVVDAQRRRDLATAVWGHLPDRMREEMRQSFRETYLPEYENLVERYYEALADQQLQAERNP